MRLNAQLPTLPRGHHRALALLREESPEIEAVISTVTSDPAFTAAVIRLANSAHSAPIVRVGSVKTAVVRIGVAATKQLVAGMVLRDAFPLTSNVIDTDELWRHLATTAMLAESSRHAEGAADDAFTAGLLHDIGRMLLASAEAPRYRKVVDLVADGTDPTTAERAIFGADHAEVGEQIALLWDLPLGVIQAIGMHHGGGTAPVARAVSEAREAAVAMGIGDGLPRPPEPESRDDERQPATNDLILRRVERYTSALRGRG